MASDPAELSRWAEQLDQIEAAFADDFGDYEASGSKSLARFVVSLYTRLTDTLRLISRELHKADTEKENTLFDRGVGMLKRFYDYIRENSEYLITDRKFLYKLRDSVLDLAGQPWISFRIDIRNHIRKMNVLTGDLEPPVQSAWDGDDLIYHKRFQRVYEKFIGLDEAARNTDEDCWRLMFRSQQCLIEAFGGLRIPLAVIKLQAYDLFDEKKRPTYIDFSCTSDEFLYGHLGRPGVLDLREKLGGPINEDQKATMERAKRPESHSLPQRRRPASPSRAEPPAQKRARTDPGYKMTMEDVDADIRDIYSDAVFMNIHERPSLDTLVTPTTENRAETLASYQDELTKRIRLYRRLYFSPEFPPRAQALRDELLHQMDEEIPLLRAEAKAASASKASAKLKEARLAVYALKFLRTLHMHLLLSSTPRVPDERLRQALIDRLSDWILYEQVWNAADAKARAATRTTTAKKTWFGGFINARNTNIEKWTDLQTQMRDAPFAAQEEEVEEEVVQAEEEEEVEEEPQQQPEQPKKTKESPFRIVTRLRGVYLLPRKPGRTVYYNERLELQHEDRRRALAKERALGPPLGGGSWVNETQWKWENERNDRIVKNFAKRGPPDFDQLSDETVFDRLVYMIVITHWRYVQGMELISTKAV
ncbi:hypothetical protein F4677DRAFT_403507 [Hypoxylon crocopeplum]|nr:hypothetical protein F4677DRAFT_403507 [Hypoxylon crocopeplum]